LYGRRRRTFPLEGIGWCQVVERPHLADLGGDQLRCAARLLHGLPRIGQLDLLDALRRDEECDALAVELRSNEMRPFESSTRYG
jgi:hypothetical protein